jgi:autoinducer 2-degrading protein
MIALYIHMQIKQEHLDAFLEVTRMNAETTHRTEPDILRFDLFQDPDDPTKFMLVEVYKDQAARDGHLNSEHFAIWKEKTADMFVERGGQYYNVAFPDLME